MLILTRICWLDLHLVQKYKMSLTNHRDTKFQVKTFKIIYQENKVDFQWNC